MGNVKDEIKEAIEILKLTEREIKKVNDEISSKICKEVEEYFTTEKNRIWLWENFKLPYISVSFNNGVGYKYLAKLVPNVNEFLWFVAESNEGDSAFLIY